MKRGDYTLEEVDAMESANVDHDTDEVSSLPEPPSSTIEEELVRKELPKNPKELEAVVSFFDNTELEVLCPLGRHTTAEELRNLVADIIEIPKEFQKYFAIWVVSDNLQMQMKNSYMPFKVLKKWVQIVKEFSYLDPYNDIPVIVFKKDALLHLGVERTIFEPACMRLFFDEMRYHVVNSNYPCTLEDAIYLAGICFALGGGEDSEDIDEIFGCAIPAHLEKQLKAGVWAERVLEASSNLVYSEDSPVELYNAYLAVGREWPYYGATFFDGEIEPQTEGVVLQERPAERVQLGVNIDGIHIINDATHALQLSLGFDQCTYDLQEGNILDGEESCLIFVFSEQDAKEQTVERKVVIWSPKASLAYPLIERLASASSKVKEFVAQRRQNTTATMRMKQGGTFKGFGSLWRGYGTDATTHPRPKKGFTLRRLKLPSFMQGTRAEPTLPPSSSTPRFTSQGSRIIKEERL